MVDYQCEECGYRWEQFYHSDPPPSERCPHMNEESPCLGYAPRILSLPGEYRPTNAKKFDPIVIWVHNEDASKVSFPGRADEPVEAGYHAVEITNLPQADYWARRINDVERQKGLSERLGEKEYWDERLKQRRADIEARIGSNPRAQALYRAVKAFVDAKRDRKYSREARYDPHGHFQVIAFDSSNRQGHADVRTDWKEKKV